METTDMRLPFSWFIFVVYVCFLLNTGSCRKSPIQNRMDKLDNYFRDEIYSIRGKLELDSEERDYLIKRLNESLEYIEQWRDEIIGYLPDNQYTGHSVSYEELYDKVANIQRGIATEKKIGISNFTRITTHINEIENNQRSMIIVGCKGKVCSNAGICIRQGETEICLCPAGYFGPDCEEEEDNPEAVEFSVAPESRDLVRGSSHIEECKAKQSHDQPIPIYTWTLNWNTIAPYEEEEGFGIIPGGLLRIDSFSEMMVGNYTCSASTNNGTIVEIPFEYRLIENCPVEIEVEPKDTQGSVGDDVLIECYSPDAEHVEWKKDGRLIEFDRWSRLKHMVNNYLYISKLEESDGGLYRCEASSATRCYSFKEMRLTVLKRLPLRSYCGTTIHEDEISTKISAGNAAKSGDYPWHVIFRAAKAGDTTERTFAGGSLISKSWVLTTSSIIKQFKDFSEKDFDSKSVKLYLGTTKCDGVGGIVRLPLEVITHETYGKRAFSDSDIALIKLDQPVEYTTSIRPICIEPATFNDAFFFSKHNMLVYGKVSGCGANWYRREYSTSLMEVAIPYVNRNKCEDMFEKLRQSVNFKAPENFRLTENMICAGHGVRRKGDTCRGDIGGALVMHAENRWVQTGIVVYGTRCDSGKLSFYTNVGQFFDWIKEITNFDQEYASASNNVK